MKLEAELSCVSLCISSIFVQFSNRPIFSSQVVIFQPVQRKMKHIKLSFFFKCHHTHSYLIEDLGYSMIRDIFKIEYKFTCKISNELTDVFKSIPGVQTRFRRRSLEGLQVQTRREVDADHRLSACFPSHKSVAVVTPLSDKTLSGQKPSVLVPVAMMMQTLAS